MTMPLVSAICPTFNRPRFLARAIALFEAQTYENKELIIIDDSVPKPEIIQRPNIIHHYLPERMWVLPKYRVAFALAQGAYFCTWDDDDWHGPNRFRHQVDAMEDRGLDACGYEVRTMVSLPGPRFVKFKRETVARWMSQLVRKPIPFHDSSAMWRSAWYRQFPLDVWSGTQISWFSKMMDEGGELRCLPFKDDFVYVRHPHCGWNFEVDALCEPAERPEFVTDEMMEFWSDERLTQEGVAA